jgi:hypothetical protein
MVTAGADVVERWITGSTGNAQATEIAASLIQTPAVSIIVFSIALIPLT